MSKWITLGGDRLGSGKKMQVELHGYERSTHDLSYVWRSTMSAGTLVPFLVEIGLPGDTFDIKLDAHVLTHPTTGPLFGTYKLQLDLFDAGIRLYQGLLHNNKLGIGRQMANVKMPLMNFWSYPSNSNSGKTDIDNIQINPSCVLAYLGIRGVAWNATSTAWERQFNAVPLIMYWDVYKNYYANKQEEIGYVVHTNQPVYNQTVTSVVVNTTTLPQYPSTTGIVIARNGDAIAINYTGSDPDPKYIIANIYQLGQISIWELCGGAMTTNGTSWTGTYDWVRFGDQRIINWQYIGISNVPVSPPRLEKFDLVNIDTMREEILSFQSLGTPFVINTLTGLKPYAFLTSQLPNPDYSSLVYSQEGLAVKTYQSDIFNNWLSTEWIDGPNGVNTMSRISTAAGYFTLDALYLGNKIYQMLNRVNVTGGSYDDWMDSVYMHERYVRPETPTYRGGLIKELVFQEVVSNSESTTDNGTQPLGTIAGKGTLSSKHKGGYATIKLDEPSYLMGIVSLTPRIDYSQGNRWFTYSILSMDDLHKPAMDQIGFQDSNTEQMAWWSNYWNGTTLVRPSYGKQTGWIHYQTNFNRTYGNFAIQSNEMFMTLNRRYEPSYTGGPTGHAIIKDLTTYIDPAKFNNIFAQTSLDAQNFWVQIAVDMIARRKMSAKVMPNL